MAIPESPTHSENHSWPWGEAEVAFSSATKQSVMTAPLLGLALWCLLYFNSYTY